MTANLPYHPTEITDIDYYQTFFGLFLFCKCCEVSCSIFVGDEKPVLAL